MTLWPHTSPPLQMILNQRIWLDENIAIRLKHTKHDVNLDHSSFPFAKNSVIEKKRWKCDDENKPGQICVFILNPELKMKKKYLQNHGIIPSDKKREKIWIDITYDKNRKYLQYNQMNS